MQPFRFFYSSNKENSYSRSLSSNHAAVPYGQTTPSNPTAPDRYTGSWQNSQAIHGHYLNSRPSGSNDARNYMATTGSINMPTLYAPLPSTIQRQAGLQLPSSQTFTWVDRTYNNVLQPSSAVNISKNLVGNSQRSKDDCVPNTSRKSAMNGDQRAPGDSVSRANHQNNDNGGDSSRIHEDEGPQSDVGEPNNGPEAGDDQANGTNETVSRHNPVRLDKAAHPSSILENESTTWASRNPGKAIQPVRHHPSRPKTDAERLSSKMRTTKSREDAKLLQEAVAEVQNYCKEKAQEIAGRFNKKPEYVHGLIYSATIFKPTRNPNRYNALVHKKAREVNAELPEGERVPLSEIQALVKDHLLEHDLSESEVQDAVKELEEHRQLKKKGARATNLAAAQDLKNTMMRLDTELNNLHDRTGSYAFALVTRGHVHDKGIPGWAASSDTTLFIRDVLKMDIWDLLRKFELWAVTRDKNPNIDTLLSMRTECSSLISEGLRTITGNKKIIMNYAHYPIAIVQKYRVKLDGWPACIPFTTPHSICTVDEIRLLRHHLQEKKCKWVNITLEEAKKHMEDYASKVQEGVTKGRKRKVRSDKGKPRKKRALLSDHDGDDVDENADENNEDNGGHVDENEDNEDNGGPRRSRRISKAKFKGKERIDDSDPDDDGPDSSGNEYDDDESI